MIERPSRVWRKQVDEQAAAVAAGTLDPSKAYAAELWPAAFITAVDEALAAYETEARSLAGADDDTVWAAVERVVTALNDADEEHGAIETGERESLAEYVYVVLKQAGVDVASLAARRDLDEYAITDPWREW